ncbi:MAG: Mbeg1-like protein, partial [Geminicoccaceae bacterium]
TVNYSASEFFGSLTKSPRDAAIEMANAEFGVQAQVTRREINRDIDQKLAETDQQIADVDQRLADINQQLSPQMQNGVGGLGTIGFAPLDDARALMAEGRTLTEQKSALEAQRAGLEQARNLPDTMDMGFISRDVYEAQSKLTNSHINRLSDQDLAELGFEPSLLENKETGFRASVYRNSNTGETVLAFQGTNFDSVEDWKNNVAQGLGLTSPQYEQAKEVATEFQQAFAGENLALTGHSLGGGMAAYASLSTGIEATTFNAAGLNPRTLDRIGATREEALGLVSAHHVNGEALNWAQDSTAADLAAAGILGYGYARSSNFDPVPEALGTRFSYEAVSINGLPPDYQGNLLDDLGERVDLHLMESVLNTLQQERQRIFDETRLQ